VWNEPQPLGSETAVQEAAYANHVNAVFALLYIQAQLNGGIPLDQLQSFTSLHPEIKKVWGLLWSETWWGVGTSGLWALNQADIYGWSIVENPLAQAGMMAEGPAEAAFIATGAAIVGPPAFAEFATSSVGDFLFARGTGLLNSGPIRMGWSWAGNARWGLGETLGTEVFRIVVAGAHIFPWYALWSWQVPIH
jgi:hypothetical protein